MSYFNIYAAAVPEANKQAYLDHAIIFAEMAKQHGALDYCETWGSNVPDGEVTSFPLAVQKKDDEVVVVGWIKWPNKETSDAAWAKIMEDPRMDPSKNPMPFDGKRMIFGDFEALLGG